MPTSVDIDWFVKSDKIDPDLTTIDMLTIKGFGDWEIQVYFGRQYILGRSRRVD